MKNLFNSVKMQRPKYNRFDLTHDVKLSLDMGQLIPIMCLETVPGDKITIGADALFRMAPMLAPMMHRVDTFIHYFFVPNRILWQNWENFITGNYPGTLGFPEVPYINLVGPLYTSLCDYFGIPTPLAPDIVEKVNALPFAAYLKIYNDFYRDQNLQADLIPPQTFPLDDGDNSTTFGPGFALGNIFNRAWEHDYFTSALPFAQKGPAVPIPISGFNDVPVNVNDNAWPAGTHLTATTGPNPNVPAGNPDIPIDLYAATSGLSAVDSTINDLRRAYALQSWFERNARGGTRYAEHIKAHWGITVPDYRLQRPEYIVGVKSPLVISEVLNTTGTDTLPQGNMSGHGISVTTGKFNTYTASEHGFCIGILSVMPKTAYQQGLEKFWDKIADPTQYFYPSFAHIGEQEVKNKEVYAWQGAGAGDETFGYVPRYAEYKYMNSRVAGDFRDTLDFWHMGRIFDAPPALNGDFIASDPTLRIFSVETEVNHVWAHVVNKVSAARMMPRYGTPATIV